MKRSPRLIISLIVESLAVLAVVAVVATQSPLRVGSGDVVADRKQLMKLNGASLEDLQAKAKAGTIEAIAVNAEAIAFRPRRAPSATDDSGILRRSPAIQSARGRFGHPPDTAHYRRHAIPLSAFAMSRYAGAGKHTGRGTL